MARTNNASALRPLHPERVCWGCDKYCPADDLSCGEDTVRTPHPTELFGDDWMAWSEANGAENTAERFLGRAEGSPGMEMDSLLVERVTAALASVIDPELGIDIVNLGLVQRIDVERGRVSVELTMTTPACPLGESIVREAEQRIVALEGVQAVEVRLVWEPVWTPERMSSTARAALGWLE